VDIDEKRHTPDAAGSRVPEAARLGKTPVSIDRHEPFGY
jgi:hypothetical protein